jgi:hypothetical protein
VSDGGIKDSTGLSTLAALSKLNIDRHMPFSNQQVLIQHTTDASVPIDERMDMFKA